MHIHARNLLAAAVAPGTAMAAPAALAKPFISFDKQWTHFASVTQGVSQSAVFDESAAEIVAYDPATQRVFVVNGDVSRVDVLSAVDGSFLGHLDVASFGGPNSVAVKNGVVAVAVENGSNAQANGNVVFFDASDATLGTGGTSTGSVEVGPLPDMVTFTPDGSKVLVANEGEPDFYGQDGTDPEGSISIVDVASKMVAGTAGFGSFTKAGLVAQGVRITGPGTGGAAEATAAQDIEPEYISVSEDGSTAYVTLQENNAVAVVDIASATVTAVQGLALKDHGQTGNGIDASDRDNAINIRTWDNVKGMPMPDSIGSYEAGGKTYYVTANEGDAREYEVPSGSTGVDYTDETRIEDIDADGKLGSAFAGLANDDNLGRLQVSEVDIDGSIPTTYDEVMSFGTRSFSIWDADTGDLVWDSGDFFETFTANLMLTDLNGDPVFNSDNDGNDSFDSRSDAKGPEPEALVLGQILNQTLAFVGLERIGGIMVFDITDPTSPMFLEYLLDRDFTVAADTLAAGDIGPEGLYFVTPGDSPFGMYGLVVASEVSGSTTWYNIQVPLPAPLALFGAGLPLLLLARRRR
jgi:DNA-binding beta-propeller fold protein YncE